MVLPSTLIPIVWIFNAPDSYYLVPVALILSGIFFSGIGVGISPLVYSLLPQGEKRTPGLASWSVAVKLNGCTRLLLGGVLAYQLQDVRWEWMPGFPITNLQIIFAISAGAQWIALTPPRRAGHQRYDISRADLPDAPRQLVELCL